MERIIVSDEFKTKQELPNIKRQIKSDIAKLFNLERNQVRIPVGFISLEKKVSNDRWIGLTSVMMDFDKWIKEDTSYRLKTKKIYIKD